MIKKILRRLRKKEMVLGKMVIRKHNDELRIVWLPKYNKMDRAIVFGVMETMRDTSVAYSKIMSNFNKKGGMNGTKNDKTKSNYFG